MSGGQVIAGWPEARPRSPLACRLTRRRIVVSLTRMPRRTIKRLGGATAHVLAEQPDDPRQAVSLTRERARSSRKGFGKDLSIAAFVPAAPAARSHPDRNWCPLSGDIAKRVYEPERNEGTCRRRPSGETIMEQRRGKSPPWRPS